MWTYGWKLNFQFDLHHLLTISVFSTSAFVSVCWICWYVWCCYERELCFLCFLFLLLFLIPSSDVFDWEHVPYSTCMHSTNSLAEKKGGKFFPVSETNREVKPSEFGGFVNPVRGKKNECICTMERILLLMAHNRSVTVILGLSRGK